MVFGKKGQATLAEGLIWSLILGIYIAASPVLFPLALTMSRDVGGVAGFLIIVLPVAGALFVLIRFVKAWSGSSASGR